MRAHDYSNDGDEPVDGNAPIYNSAPIDNSAPVVAAVDVDVTGSLTRVAKGKQREVTVLYFPPNSCY